MSTPARFYYGESSPDVEQVLKMTKRRFGFTAEALKGASRLRPIVAARHAAWVELRALGWSYPEIGAVFNRDHTSVMYGVRVATARGYVASMRRCPEAPTQLPELPDLDVPTRKEEDRCRSSRSS